MCTNNVVIGMKMTIDNRVNAIKRVHHSDRGFPYCSSVNKDKLKKFNTIVLMKNECQCYQNAIALCINGILILEILIKNCSKGKELKQLITETIKGIKLKYHI